MAYEELKYEDFSAEFRRLVDQGDLCGAGRFLCGITKQDKKTIVSKKQEISAMLLVAAGTGNTDVVEFLVRDCQANIHEGDSVLFCNRKPLWWAAANGRLEVVKLLQELGADVNAASNTGTSAVNQACYGRQTETVKFLVKQGADIHRPDKRGETCLMKSVPCLELCQFLINSGARVNEQDNLGNTALHHAIENNHLQAVQFLLDNGANQNIKNKLGDDALQFASFHGRELIVKELEVRQKPTASRWIESLQLLGSYSLFSEAADSVERALFFWKRSSELQMVNPAEELRKVEMIPDYMHVKEVNTVEKLEQLCQDDEVMHIYALENLLRIRGPSREEITRILFNVSIFCFRNGKDRRVFNLLKYALHRVQDCCTPKWLEEYLFVLTRLCKWRPTSFRGTQFQIEFHDVFEILDMLTSMAQSIFDNHSNQICITRCMNSTLHFVRFVVQLDKSSDQLVSFKRAIHRLVQSQMRDYNNRTFLHSAVEFCDTYPGLAEVLLECGADVNSVDSEHNTPLHLINSRLYTESSWRYSISRPSQPKRRSEIIKLLLEYSAHPDIVNKHGHFAATGLSLNMLDHVNLKCLATAIIRDHQIPYVGQIPESLVSFVQMHGKCPSENFRSLKFFHRKR